MAAILEIVSPLIVKSDFQNGIHLENIATPRKSMVILPWDHRRTSLYLQLCPIGFQDGRHLENLVIPTAHKPMVLSSRAYHSHFSYFHDCR